MVVADHSGEVSYRPGDLEIEQALRKGLTGMAPGAPLPSDAELCEEFGVSRMTARNAVHRLAQEGLVLRVPGRGTFVGNSPTHRRANSLLSFSNEMRRRGHVPSSQLLTRALRAPPQEAADRLQLKDGEKLVLLNPIRLADARPIPLEICRLHAPTPTPSLKATLEKESLHT